MVASKQGMKMKTVKFKIDPTKPSAARARLADLIDQKNVAGPRQLDIGLKIRVAAMMVLLEEAKDAVSQLEAARREFDARLNSVNSVVNFVVEAANAPKNVPDEWRAVYVGLENLKQQIDETRAASGIEWQASRYGVVDKSWAALADALLSNPTATLEWAQ